MILRFLKGPRDDKQETAGHGATKNLILIQYPGRRQAHRSIRDQNQSPRQRRLILGRPFKAGTAVDNECSSRSDD